MEKTDLQRPLAGIDPNREIALGLRSSNDDTARAALTKLVMDLDPKLHRWLKRTIADENEIADLLQETWKRAWRRRATVDPNRFCNAWAYRLCRNVMIDHIFAKARRAEVGSKALDGRSDPAAENPSSYGDEAQEDTSDLLQRFLDEISKLPDEDQRIVWDWARAKGDEWTEPLAAALGKAPRTLRKRWFDLKERLKKRLAKRDGSNSLVEPLPDIAPHENGQSSETMHP